MDQFCFFHYIYKDSECVNDHDFHFKQQVFFQTSQQKVNILSFVNLLKSLFKRRRVREKIKKRGFGILEMRVETCVIQ